MSGGAPQSSESPTPCRAVAGFLRKHRDKAMFFAVAAVGAIADILSKSAVFGWLGAGIASENGQPMLVPGRGAEILGESLMFRCTVNTGAVFSIFRGRWVFLALFTLISLGIILWIIFKQKEGRRVTVLGLALVCSGALGNLWDRLLYNCVRDFIDFKTSLLEPFFAGGHWPTFNLADVFITVGVGLIFVGDFILRKEAPGQAGPESGKAPGGKG